MLRTVIVCIFALIWIILLTVALYYSKMSTDCAASPNIKCYNDWECWETGNDTAPGNKSEIVNDDTDCIDPGNSSSNCHKIIPPGFYYKKGGGYPLGIYDSTTHMIHANVLNPGAGNSNCVEPVATKVNYKPDNNNCCEYDVTGKCITPAGVSGLCVPQNMCN